MGTRRAERRGEAASSPLAFPTPRIQSVLSVASRLLPMTLLLVMKFSQARGPLSFLPVFQVSQESPPPWPL